MSHMNYREMKGRNRMQDRLLGQMTRQITALCWPCDQVCHHRTANIDAVPGINLLLTIKREVSDLSSLSINCSLDDQSAN